MTYKQIEDLSDEQLYNKCIKSEDFLYKVGEMYNFLKDKEAKLRVKAILIKVMQNHTEPWVRPMLNEGCNIDLEK